MVYNSTSNNSNPNNLRNREPTYVTIKEDQKFLNIYFWNHACRLVYSNLPMLDQQSNLAFPDA